ncbi:MAG: UDP-N-acetylglucosamine 2-epimerase (non-hydrolyzing) [Spirochaetota bacterium]
MNPARTVSSAVMIAESKKILFVFGTRPEAIKMAPLIRAFLAHPDRFETKVCVTAQHREMLDQVLNFFDIRPDFDLDLMKPDQTLFDITAKALAGLARVLDEWLPDHIFVQGDTTTAFVGALAGYYRKVKVCHVEAGLRSGNMYSPFPEEGNRILAGHLSTYHFAPTEQAKVNLAREGITENVHVVQNTVIDALFLGLELIKKQGKGKYAKRFDFLNDTQRVILLTGHRRESFGAPFEDLCNATKDIAERFPDIAIVYPVHLNPNVREPVNRILAGIQNIHLIEPLDYPHLIWLMDRSCLVITDSGGIQEEAPSLGKPVLVMRDVTERMEGVEAGTAKLVGTDRKKIVSECTTLLNDRAAYDRMASSINPYGDGKASERIVAIMHSHAN